MLSDCIIKLCIILLTSVSSINKITLISYILDNELVQMASLRVEFEFSWSGIRIKTVVHSGGNVN